MNPFSNERVRQNQLNWCIISFTYHIYSIFQDKNMFNHPVSKYSVQTQWLHAITAYKIGNLFFSEKSYVDNREKLTLLQSTLRKPQLPSRNYWEQDCLRVNRLYMQFRYLQWPSLFDHYVCRHSGVSPSLTPTVYSLLRRLHFFYALTLQSVQSDLSKI